MPTKLEDIARALNVSKMTVSRAINNHPEISQETRARILETARRMNYRPNQFARALSTSRSYLIGIVVPDLMHSYFAEICRGVESQARPVGYQNLICSTDEESEKEMAEIDALLSRTDGLIVASAFAPDDDKYFRRLVTDGAKLVFIDRMFDDLSCSSVTTDDVAVGFMATEHLIKLGHRRIGHLRGTKVSTSTLREKGYEEALKRNGLEVDHKLVRKCGFTEADGHAAMSQWLREGSVPSAIFAANDAAAIGAMTAIQERGLSVPENVALIGAGMIHYGDMLRTPLSTVAWSTLEMGHQAARLLLELIDDKSDDPGIEKLIVPPTLIVRTSCGSPDNPGLNMTDGVANGQYRVL